MRKENLLPPPEWWWEFSLWSALRWGLFLLADASLYKNAVALEFLRPLLYYVLLIWFPFIACSYLGESIILRCYFNYCFIKPASFLPIFYLNFLTFLALSRLALFGLPVTNCLLNIYVKYFAMWPLVLCHMRCWRK